GDEGERRMGPRVRRLSRGGLRARGVAAASPAGRPAVRGGATRERGRRRSAYEAPHGSVAPGPVSNGAESKRRRCPRSRARQSRVTLLVAVGLGGLRLLLRRLPLLPELGNATPGALDRLADLPQGPVDVLDRR